MSSRLHVVNALLHVVNASRRQWLHVANACMSSLLACRHAFHVINARIGGCVEPAKPEAWSEPSPGPEKLENSGGAILLRIPFARIDFGNLFWGFVRGTTPGALGARKT